MTEYVTLEQAAVAFAIQSVFSTSDCLDALHYAIQKGWISPSDIAPVRHGKWISLTECANEGVYCSICKKKVWKSDYALCSHKSRNKLRSDYCPNCGSKMDGGDGNSDIA